MILASETIILEAIKLPVSDRAFLAEKLIESLDNKVNYDLSPEWKKEIKKRCSEVEKGIVELRSAKEVFDKAYSVLS